MPSFNLVAQSILSGIFIGALYGLVGLGLSLSWGLLRQINLAHFALAFLGAYLTYQLGASWHMDPLLTLVVILSASHGYMSRCVRTFAADANEKSHKFYRVLNEVPTLLMLIIVVAVIVKPF